jgi:hypothetical protein
MLTVAGAAPALLDNAIEAIAKPRTGFPFHPGERSAAGTCEARSVGGAPR